MSSEAGKALVKAKPIWRSPLHRRMLVLQCRTQIKDNLLERFAIFKQMECRLLRRPDVVPVLTKWAEKIVDECGNDFLETAKKAELPEEVVNSAEWKKAVAGAPELRWLLGKIQQPVKKDCIPEPTFPSVLTMDHPAWPYDPYMLEKYKSQYGLIKWPFLPRDRKRISRGDFERPMDDLAERGIVVTPSSGTPHRPGERSREVYKRPPPLA
eukprot:GDKI01042701.1.p1 GENE.GDKI01042701.1~~GDKI01042701.1.p1  ORF type:complete len:211 (-),score=25.13 GDKI01042701.1:34-666(-)